MNVKAHFSGMLLEDLVVLLKTCIWRFWKEKLQRKQTEVEKRRCAHVSCVRLCCAEETEPRVKD